MIFRRIGVDSDAEQLGHRIEHLIFGRRTGHRLAQGLM
jgi:hypothetical protein